jgi:spermidine/putrescine transport system ATP-binding protein
LRSTQGLVIRAKRAGDVNAGDAVAAFVRPETLSLARDAGELSSTGQVLRGRIHSLLFDGANSAVLVDEQSTSTQFHIALSQTGSHADLRAGEDVAFGFDPLRALCFRTGDAR